ncbi:MAG: hypothetical protein AAGK00_12475 [Pseudomonadota bacterium]
MRVRIDHQELRKGFSLKKSFYQVSAQVDFTEVQLHVIQDRYLADYVIMERVPANARIDDNLDWYTLRIKHLLDGKVDHHLCSDPVAAKNYEGDLLDRLRLLKEFLGGNEEIGGLKGR